MLVMTARHEWLLNGATIYMSGCCPGASGAAVVSDHCFLCLECLCFRVTWHVFVGVQAYAFTIKEACQRRLVCEARAIWVGRTIRPALPGTCMLLKPACATSPAMLARHSPRPLQRPFGVGAPQNISTRTSCAAAGTSMGCSSNIPSPLRAVASWSMKPSPVLS